MRTLLFSILTASCLASCVGCIVPAYSADPARRTQQLLITSENLRMLLEDWERIWFLAQPSHLSPYRTDGGVI